MTCSRDHTDRASTWSPPGRARQTAPRLPYRPRSIRSTAAAGRPRHRRRSRRASSAVSSRNEVRPAPSPRQLDHRGSAPRCRMDATVDTFSRNSFVRIFPVRGSADRLPQPVRRPSAESPVGGGAWTFIGQPQQTRLRPRWRRKGAGRSAGQSRRFKNCASRSCRARHHQAGAGGAFAAALSVPQAPAVPGCRECRNGASGHQTGRADRLSAQLLIREWARAEQPSAAARLDASPAAEQSTCCWGAKFRRIIRSNRTLVNSSLASKVSGQTASRAASDHRRRQRARPASVGGRAGPPEEFKTLVVGRHSRRVRSPALGQQPAGVGSASTNNRPRSNTRSRLQCAGIWSAASGPNGVSQD